MRLWRKAKFYSQIFAHISRMAFIMTENLKPFVTVTLRGPQDGGDFGPFTPGTRTSGLQEAVDYACRHRRDLIVYGQHDDDHDFFPGSIEEPNVKAYFLHETLRIPCGQEFHIFAGGASIFYLPNHGDAMIINSQMNSNFDFGLIVGNTDGAVVRMKPTLEGPDRMCVITASEFHFMGVVFDCFKNDDWRGSGLVLDSSDGSISNNRITCAEINNTHNLLYISDNAGKGAGINNNSIDVRFGNLGHCNASCIGAKIGDPGSKYIKENDFDIRLFPPQNAHFDYELGRYVTDSKYTISAEAIGMLIHGQSNRFRVLRNNSFSPGTDIMFGPDASYNTVELDGAFPCAVRNDSILSNNRVTMPRIQTGSIIETPNFPVSGETYKNRSCYRLAVYILEAGDVSNYEITNPEAQTLRFSAPLHAGQMLLLDSGDSISFTYAKQPVWQWRRIDD